MITSMFTFIFVGYDYYPSKWNFCNAVDTYSLAMDVIGAIALESENYDWYFIIPVEKNMPLHNLRIDGRFE